MDPKKLILIKNDEGYCFHCTKETLIVSPVLREIIQKDNGTDNGPLFLMGMSKDTLQRVLWWMDNHREDSVLEEGEFLDEEFDAWNRCFFDTTADNILKLISAANYLDIKRLYVLATKKLAEIMDEKMCEKDSIQSIRKTFQFENPIHPNPKERVIQMLVFDKSQRSNTQESRIDIPDVGVVYLPPRKLKPRPKPRNNNLPDRDVFRQ